MVLDLTSNLNNLDESLLPYGQGAIKLALSANIVFDALKYVQLPANFNYWALDDVFLISVDKSLTRYICLTIFDLFQSLIRLYQ